MNEEDLSFKKELQEIKKKAEDECVSVTRWNEEKRFGFVKTKQGDAFIHASAFSSHQPVELSPGVKIKVVTIDKADKGLKISKAISATDYVYDQLKDIIAEKIQLAIDEANEEIKKDIESDINVLSISNGTNIADEQQLDISISISEKKMHTGVVAVPPRTPEGQVSTSVFAEYPYPVDYFAKFVRDNILKTLSEVIEVDGRTIQELQDQFGRGIRVNLKLANDKIKEHINSLPEIQTFRENMGYVFEEKQEQDRLRQESATNERQKKVSELESGQAAETSEQYLNQAFSGEVITDQQSLEKLFFPITEGIIGSRKGVEEPRSHGTGYFVDMLPPDDPRDSSKYYALFLQAWQRVYENHEDYTAWQVLNWCNKNNIVRRDYRERGMRLESSPDTMRDGYVVDYTTRMQPQINFNIPADYEHLPENLSEDATENIRRQIRDNIEKKEVLDSAVSELDLDEIKRRAEIIGTQVEGRCNSNNKRRSGFYRLKMDLDSLVYGVDGIKDADKLRERVAEINGKIEELEGIINGIKESEEARREARRAAKEQLVASEEARIKAEEQTQEPDAVVSEGRTEEDTPPSEESLSLLENRFKNR